MKRHLQTFNLKIITLIFITFSIPAIITFAGGKCFAADIQPPSAQKPMQTAAPIASPTSETEKPAKKIDSIPEKNAYALTHMEKGGFKYGLFKFFIAMLGVLISCLAIFGGLKLYKKIILKGSAKFDNIDYNKTLESPKDFKEAINLFLDKTDK